ncbi:MAG: IPExxxVDY family protein [Candidatus Cyclobacteriaceae bacterium M3_2C_046]
MKKSKLRVDYEYDFYLWGIVSLAKDYKLAWLLNQICHIQLKKTEDLSFTFINQNKLIISSFLFETENAQFRLLRNKSLDEHKSLFLLPEIKQFDYLFIINDKTDTFNTEQFQSNLNQKELVQYATRLDINKLKSKENLIF